MGTIIALHPQENLCIRKEGVYKGLSMTSDSKMPVPLTLKMYSVLSSVGRRVVVNPMDRGAWWATVHGAAKSWTRLSN